MADIKVERIGLPPEYETYVSRHVVENTMPLAEIYPCKPQFKTGMTLFTLEEDWTAYSNIIKNLGFSVGDSPLRVSFLADNFPTDTFTNEYGETFLTKMADVASGSIRDLMQITGTRTLGGATGKISDYLKDLGEKSGGAVKTGLAAAGKMTEKAEMGLRSIENRFAGAKTISGLLAGNRVDFPQVWKSSGFSPSYTMTIRLFNPKPWNVEVTKKYIIGPLAAILALGVPQSKDGSTYSWPFFHKVKSPGIYNLNPAVITNISVIKGGDQQQISQGQLLGMVDVRIDFVSLFNSLLVETEGSKIKNRPTLKSYLDALKEEKPIPDPHYFGVEVEATALDVEGPRLIAPRTQPASTATGPITPRARAADVAAAEGLLLE